MAAATDIQMQQFADLRLRPGAERIRNLELAFIDDIAAIDDIYARAVSNNRWDDSRQDGPPHLLQSGNSANPDDILNYNSFMALFRKFLSGTFVSLEEANSAAANWNVVKDACVRNVGMQLP